MQTYVYIDAANLFYGGKKSLGWSVDFEKLYKYLHERFDVSQVYYFGGVEIHKFPFDYLTNDTVSLKDLERYLIDYTEKNKKDLTSAMLVLLDRHLKQVRFYQKLENFGFQLILKPEKMFRRPRNWLFSNKVAKRAVSIPVLKHLREVAKKEVLVLSRGPRTAKEIKRFAGDKFMDLTNNNLREKLERVDL